MYTIRKNKENSFLTDEEKTHFREITHYFPLKWLALFCPRLNCIRVVVIES